MNGVETLNLFLFLISDIIRLYYIFTQILILFVGFFTSVALPIKDLL